MLRAEGEPMPHTRVTTVRSECNLPELPALQVLPPLLSFGLTLLVLSLCCVAQQQGQAGAMPDAPSTTQQQETKPGGMINSTVQTGAEFVSLLNRKSRVFPILATNTGPLSPQEKFKLFANNSVAVSGFVAAALNAGINQAYDSPAGYGAGGEGYAKRYGAALARRASSQFFGTFLLASALHQDPRFFVRSDLNFGGSIKYAVRRVFVTRTDAGDPAFNWSGLLGMLGSEGLANVYYPDNYRTVGNTFSRFGYDMLGNAGGNLLRQYWPRITRKLKLVQPQATPGATSGAAKP